MSNDTVNELARAIRNASPVTTDPYDFYGWIADAIDLLNGPAEARVAEAVSPSEEVEETGVVGRSTVGLWRCIHCGELSGVESLGERQGFKVHMASRFEGGCKHEFELVEPRPTPSSPSEPTTVEPLEGEWRRVSELLGHGVWDINHGTHGETVRVPLAVEQAIRAEAEERVNYWRHYYNEALDSATVANAHRATAERRLEGHENLAAAAIRERDEARGEVERLQAALTRIRDKSSVPCGICPVDAPCSNCIARRALMEARVSTPVREERGE